MSSSWHRDAAVQIQTLGKMAKQAHEKMLNIANY